MNHSGIGYIDDHKLVLPIDILRPLSIGDNSCVVAVYYPWNISSTENRLAKYHDLMITPVPTRYWPVMGRLLVRLWHFQGTFAEVAMWLRNRNVSILNAECSRSAHRYATWNLTIAFDSLLGKRNVFDSKASEHRETKKAIERLQDDLEKAFPKDVLFRDPRDAGLQKAVEGVPARAHSYFHNYISEHEERTLVGPFELYCSHSQLHSRDSKLAALLDKIQNRSEELAPTCVVAEMDYRDFNIRVALIPPKDLQYYFEVIIPYRRHGGLSTCGLVATVTEQLVNRYNLWRVFNITSQNGEDIETGEVYLCLEDCEKKQKGKSVRYSDLEKAIENIRLGMSLKGPKETKILPHCHINHITHEIVQSRLIRDRVIQTGIRYDVFISYGKKDGYQSSKRIKNLLEAQGIRTHLDEAELKPGEDWLQRLIEGIRLSAEVLVVCTRKSLDRPAIAIEIGCALGLGKPVTAVICNDIEDNEIPDYLRRYQWIVLRKDRKLSEYGKSVLERIANNTFF